MKTSRRNLEHAGWIAVVFVLAAACASERTDERGSATAITPARSASGSWDSFLAAYPVFMHPRCMNCHPAGDVPLVGDDSHPHPQGVKRGPAGNGRFGMTCSACHQAENVPGAHMPPGNPEWHLPPPEAPMIFQGRSARELALQFKEPSQTKGRSLAQLVDHVTHDALVLGSWNPGEGRSLPPLSHSEFARHFAAWVEAGAPVP